MLIKLMAHAARKLGRVNRASVAGYQMGAVETTAACRVARRQLRGETVSLKPLGLGGEDIARALFS